MASNGTGKVPLVDEAEGSETTIEIKIKTLDSQTYTMRVDKQMPVPALKEQIASVTGVLSEQQRLICRGKVLKDDQLLSAYHVEDGHTLHLVVRQPVLQSSEGMAHNPATGPASSTNRSHGGQVGPSVVIETFSVPDHGDGVPPEISRIVSAVLSSFAFANMTSGSGGIEVVRERGVQRTSGASATSSGSQQQSDQSGSRVQSDRSQSAFGLSTAVPLGSLHPPVIPDSLTTLSQYLSLIRREVDVIGRSRENNAQGDETIGTELRETDPASQSGPERERLPTPASLAEVLLSSRQLLIEQIAECLSQLARQLQNQANVTDPAARLSTQSTAWGTGVLLHSLGAFLLELGRTTMTLRLGQGPSEAVVNAGPAVFINPSGPNPLMVQPLPFQSGTSVGSVPVGSVQPGSSMGNGIGTGFLPRRIDIQIRRGSSTATPNGNREERSDTQQSTGQRNSTLSSGGENISNQPTARVDSSSFAGESGVRVVPIRTMMAAVPSSFSRLSSDSSGIGLYYPVVGRLHPVTPGIGTGGQGSQASGDQHPSSVQNEEHSTPQAAVQGQNVEHRIRDGSLPTPSSRQQGNSTARNININVVSASGPQNNQETERRMPHNILQFLRNLFPGGEIHVEDARFQGTDTHSTPENAGASNDPMQVEPTVTDEAIFLSSMLREFMPLITQHQGAEPNDTAQDSSAQAESSHVGTSRRHSDSEPSPPNSKRQKSE